MSFAYAVIASKDLSIDAAHAENILCPSVTIIFELAVRNSYTGPSLYGSLFLLGTLLVGLVLGPLLTDTHETSLGAGVTQLPVRILLALVVSNFALLESDEVLDGKDINGGLDGVLALLGGLDILSRSITVLRLAIAAREEDEALLVFLEALHVGFEALLREVLAAGIDGDTNGGCELTGNASSLEKLASVM